jgi:serine/threonine protein kinase
MDDLTAQKMTTELEGSTVGGWRVDTYINHGKSAAVFLAEKDGVRAALKVFDPEVVQRYGRDAQLTRIKRELSLVGKAHPNVIRLLDGGESNQLLFVAMEYFQSRNLADCLQEIPHTEVRSLIAQLASAAKFLEDLSFAHRDIKPENIGLTPDMKTAKLLDLGVIRPFDLSSVTDEGDQRFFVGTLQYSPPELLFREEEQSIEAWRAITFYQLGGVLHDLLMRKPLFKEFENPYARLVRAVEREIPRVEAKDGDADLRLLAQNCLAKRPRQRLETVKWEDFSQPKVSDPSDAARRRIAQHRTAASQAGPRVLAPLEDLKNQQIFVLRTCIHSAIVNTCVTENLPRYSIREVRKNDSKLLRALFELSGKRNSGPCLAVYCQGTVLDSNADLHELRLWGCTSPTVTAAPEEPPPGAPYCSTRGALIEQDIRAWVNQFLLLAYAEALDYGPNESEPVYWLRIESAS